ncbi:MAG: hypothetical protein EA390_05415 [Balneolaceae bacterium]|nr:MAG: hypothetical protein EA390_05415 [Balneolaceae bacterium]
MISPIAIEDELKSRFKELSKPMDAIPTGTEPRLKTLPGVRVLMYDFYGTLFLSGVGDIGIDDGKSDAGLMTEVLKSAGIKIKDPKAGERSFEIYTEVVQIEIEEFKKAGVRYPEPDIRKIWRDILVTLHNEDLIVSIPDAFTNYRVSVEFEARMNPVWPVDGAAETLLHYKKEGLLQGILSNSQFYTPIVLEALMDKSMTKLGFHEELLHWSFEEKNKKPGLIFYRSFLEKLRKVEPSVKPEEVLYAGNDMLKDIYPASELGMKTALFAGDKRSLKWRRDDDRCKNLQPDIVFTEFKQLKEVV